MATTTRIDPIARDIKLIVAQETSRSAAQAKIAEYARGVLAEAKSQNARALGHETPYKTWVNGTEGGTEENVNPDGGSIAYEFELFSEAVGWIYDQLRQHAPKGPTGRYERNLVVYADGSQVGDPNKPPTADEYVFVDTVAYARKVERWHDVFQAVAAIARGRFGNLAKIDFGYRPLQSGDLANWARKSTHRRVRRRNPSTEWLSAAPAIIMKMR